MQARQSELNADGWDVADLPEMGVGIGVNTGRVIAGTVGGGGRLEYTVVGDAVNIASRLQNEAAGGEIVATASTVAAADGIECEPIGMRQVKGREEAVEVFRVRSRPAMTLSERRLRWLARAALAIVVVGSAATIALEIAAGRPDEAVFSALLLSFPVVGFFVLSRRPDNRLAWLMVAMGLFAAILGPVQGYGAYAVEHDLPFGPRWASRSAARGGCPSSRSLGFLLLLFPDGHLPSPRWRWFAWMCGIAMAVVFVAIWFYPGDFADSGYPEIENPIGIEALEAGGSTSSGSCCSRRRCSWSAASSRLVVRMRRTTDDVVRHQIRWLAYAASLMAAASSRCRSSPGSATTTRGTRWIQNLERDELHVDPRRDRRRDPAVPPLRHRRRDPQDRRDRDRRGVHRPGLRGRGGGRRRARGVDAEPRCSPRSPPAIVALVFQPVRARARRFADRVVYGKRATPYEVVATFGDQLAGTYSADDVLPRMARVLGEGVGADRAEVRMVVR